MSLINMDVSRLGDLKPEYRPESPLFLTAKCVFAELLLLPLPPAFPGGVVYSCFWDQVESRVCKYVNQLWLMVQPFRLFLPL